MSQRHHVHCYSRVILLYTLTSKHHSQPHQNSLRSIQLHRDTMIMHHRQIRVLNRFQPGIRVRILQTIKVLH
jgi:hypothetical protein